MMIVEYLDTKINMSNLISAGEVLEKVRGTVIGDGLTAVDDYLEGEYGINLIWHIPFSPHERSAGAVVPVKEGFLFLPYKDMDPEIGVSYDIDNFQLLDKTTTAILRNEHLDYSKGLCAALDDIIHILDKDMDKAGQTGTLAPIPIIIEVRGGLVQCVHVPEENTTYDIVVADYDNLQNSCGEEGEPHDEEVERAQGLLKTRNFRTVY